MTKGRYTFSVEQPGLNDLTNISFDEFVPLIFERAMPPEAEKVDLSFHYVEVELDAKKICAYYVRLFREPEFLLSRFTKQQLEGGFWAIMGHTHEWSAGNIIEYSDAPLSSRRECIESMATLFERLFANEPLETSVHMWWDSLCHPQTMELIERFIDDHRSLTHEQKAYALAAAKFDVM